MVAGLEEVTEGQIMIGGRDVTDAAPKDRDIAMVFQSYALYPHLTVRRNIAMVFQSYALYPHMTVYDNMAFGLKLHGLRKREIEPRVTSAPPIRTVPAVTSSRPAIIRRSVDLPQPDGPTRTTNSPSAISMLTSSTAWNPLP